MNEGGNNRRPGGFREGVPSSYGRSEAEVQELIIQRRLAELEAARPKRRRQSRESGKGDGP